jgi:hypothetical protein
MDGIEIGCCLFLPIFGSPSFHEADSDSAYSRESIYSFVALINGLVGHLYKVGFVEDLQVAAGRNFNNSGQVPIVALITIRALHEYGIVAETFGEDLSVLVAES